MRGIEEENLIPVNLVKTELANQRLVPFHAMAEKIRGGAEFVKKYRSEVVLLSTSVLISLMMLGVGQEPEVVFANGPTFTPTPTATTEKEERTRIIVVTATPTNTTEPTAIPTVTPTPTITPNAFATRITEAKELIEFQQTLDALRNPTPIPVPPPQQVPAPGVVIVHPEVVKPEVVKPEVIKVPEPYRIEVQVTPVPDPDAITMDRKTLDRFIEEGVKIALTAQPRLTPTPTPVSKLTETPTPVVVNRVWGFPWDPPWGLILAGGIGILLGLGAATREVVVERLHRHHH